MEPLSSHINEIRYILIPILLIGSMFFSGSEAAFFSLDRLQLDRLHHAEGRRYSWIQHLISRPRQLLLTILTGNELVNVGMAMIMTEIIHETLQPRGLDQWSPLLNSLLLTPFLVVFGEITPKIIALRVNYRMVQTFGPFLYVFFVLYRPLRNVLYNVIRLILKAIGISNERFNPLTEDEFMMMIRESQKAGHLDPKDQEYIKNVFEFTEHKGIEIMKNIDDCLMFPANLYVDEAIRLIQENGYSRAPVYDNHRENIVGIVYARDLLRVKTFYASSASEMRLKYIMRPAHFVGAMWSINKILRDMKKHRRQIVVVQGENAPNQKRRHAIGILTMEDLIEELFGSIEDEKDIEKDTSA